MEGLEGSPIIERKRTCSEENIRDLEKLLEKDLKIYNL